MVRVDADFKFEYPEGDAASTEAYATVARAGAACMQELERFVTTQLDMPMAAATVLAVLDGANGALTPSQIGERVFVASASLTSILDLLERRGLARRVPNPSDRRSTLVEITRKGSTTADRLLPAIRSIERKAFDLLSSDERIQLVSVLSKVLARLADMANGPPQQMDGVRERPTRLAQAPEPEDAD